jgi:hypothetical protein
MESAARWTAATRKVRQEWLPDSRVFEYKSLRDRVRQRTLARFLASADELPGTLFCFAIPKRVRSMFRERETGETSEVWRRLDEMIRPTVREKLMRVTHLLGLLLAGLTATGQDVFWVTDEDALAVPTYPRLRLLTDVLAAVSSNILQHNLGHLRVHTSKDAGDLAVSDLMSIADLAAGVIADLLSDKVQLHRTPTTNLTLPYLRLVPEPADILSRWFAAETGVLRHVAIVIDEAEPRGLRAARLNLHASALPPIPFL